jgi:hypothetical protein
LVVEGGHQHDGGDVLRMRVPDVGAQGRRRAASANHPSDGRRSRLRNHGGLSETKPHEVLGTLKYSEPVSGDAIDAYRIKTRLKAMALERYPDRADAVIEVKSDVQFSGEAATVTVSGEVIQFESSADRELMHKMWDNLYDHYPVVSPK